MKRKILSFILMGALAFGVVCTETDSLHWGKLEVNAQSTLENPVISADASKISGQKVTWDCVYFGYYPQTEIVADASQCGTSKKDWGKETDYEVDAQVYAKLQSTQYTPTGDTIINGVKYRRVKKTDATHIPQSGDDIPRYYQWVSSIPYHYFRYEPIKWRVLKVDGDEALLLSDVMLDGQKYNQISSGVTWKTSTLRCWLNGYGASENTAQADFNGKNFINSAFKSVEKEAVITKEIPNYNNITYQTAGGDSTCDPVLLLSENEVYATALANSYGFISVKEKNDEGKRAKSSTYAKAMGTWTNTEDGYLGNGIWWMRSPGKTDSWAGYVCNYGLIRDFGEPVDNNYMGVRPSIYLDLSKDVWNYAGTVCSDETINAEPAPSIEVFADEVLEYVDDEEEKPEEPSKTTQKQFVSGVKVTSALSTRIVARKKVRLNAAVSPSNAANKSVKWVSSNNKYATVDRNGVVTTKAAGKGKKVTITAIASDGSKKQGSIKLTIMKHQVKSISINAPKTLARGKSKKLTVKVKTNGKSANKSVSWKSSNTKIATVSKTGKVKIQKKAKKGATVKITASSLDGTNKKKTVKIKVK